MIEKGPVSVLIAPLDWGLGHATRCIPIIKELIHQGAQVRVAANNVQKTLLEQEFPTLEFLEIPGYKIEYKGGIFLKWGLFFNIPRILRHIKKENKWFQKILLNLKIDAVISDNRYGLYDSKCLCVFITHQLYIQSGWGSRNLMNSWINRQIMKWHYTFISKFSSCWVPDQEVVSPVAGLLSHPPVLPAIPVKYFGILSRFSYSEKKTEKNEMLIILSGPEPQRTRFENILFGQLADFQMKTVVVRGLPLKDPPVPFFREGIKIFNHLPSHEIEELLNRSEIIIARSGYSTIMDLLVLKRNAILVPTPGQTEQEYLGQYLHEKKWMYTVRQKGFDLTKSVIEFRKKELLSPGIPDSKLQIFIEKFLREVVDRNINGGK